MSRDSKWVAPGVERVRTVDAMSSVESFRISIPAYGPSPDIDELGELLKSSACSRSLSEIRREIDAQLQNMIPNSPQVESELSQRAFYERISHRLEQLENLLAHTPDNGRDVLEKAMIISVKLGEMMATAALRSEHLEDVIREKEKMQPARTRGGKAKRGRLKEDTLEILELMVRKVDEQGMSVSQAAVQVKRIYPSRSPDAIRQVYYARNNKKT